MNRLIVLIISIFFLTQCSVSEKLNLWKGEEKKTEKVKNIHHNAIILTIGCDYFREVARVNKLNLLFSKDFTSSFVESRLSTRKSVHAHAGASTQIGGRRAALGPHRGRLLG